MIRRIQEPAPPKQEAAKDVHTRAAEDKLRLALGTRVRIIRTKNGGRVEIDFSNEDELQRVYELLTE
jgi:ParB family chromosome partitioning protein